MADQGGTPAGGQDAGQGEATPASAPTVDLSPITSQLGEITGRLDRFEASLPQPEQPATADPFDFSDILGEAEPQPEPEQQPVDVQQLVARLGEATKTTSQQEIQQALAPVMETLGNVQADMDANYLIESFPEMADPDVADRVVKTADAWAKAVGIPPQLARSAAVIEKVYLAEKAAQQARGEVPVGDLTNPELEQAGGGMPNQRADSDVAAAIKAAGTPQGFWNAVQSG